MLTDGNNTIFGIPLSTPSAPSIPSSEPNACTICCGIGIACVCYAGIAAGMGAAAGSIGYQVMASNGWTVAGITYIDMVQSMAAGSAVLAPLGFCLGGGLSNNSDKSEEEKKKVQKGSLVTSLVFTGAMGAIDGLAGAGMLHLLTVGEQVGFVAAAGAAGNAILVLSLIGAIGVLAAGAICLGASLNGEPKLLVLPRLPGERPFLIDPLTAGMPVQSMQEMVNFVRNLPGLRQEPAKLQGAPVSEDMEARAPRPSPNV